MRRVVKIKPDVKWDGKEPLSVYHLPQFVTLTFPKKVGK